MDLYLSDKVVPITGASRGIGLATAKAFAMEGCRLMLSARSEATLAVAEDALRTGGATMAAHAADVTQPDGAARRCGVRAPNAKDWTLRGFLAAKPIYGGLGLDIAQDEPTRQAVTTAAPKLFEMQIEELTGERLDTP
jgi:NAD(P)-dependent dehydrogenase (short-subunit alcohol dehydrogenase family)